jgi:putative transcriptional regulator
MRQALIDRRIDKGLTQESLAEKVGISRSFYGLIELGSRNPSYGLAKKIAKVLGVKVDRVFFDLDSYRLKHDKKTG